MTKAYPLKLNKLLLQPKYVKFSYYLTGNACTLIFIKKKKRKTRNWNKIAQTIVIACICKLFLSSNRQCTHVKGTFNTL